MVTSYKYLGRVLTEADNNWTAMVGNLWKAGTSWAWLVRIMGWEGDRYRGFFQVGGAGGTPIWVGDMSDDPSHGHIPGEFLAHIFQTDYG